MNVIAIDGPAGTGKSSTARGVATALGWKYVDSGAFYRVAALLALRHGFDPGDSGGRADLRTALERSEIDFEARAESVRTHLDGADVSRDIRSRAVTQIVSRVAEDPELRKLVNSELRRRVGTDPAVVDGRDIGTVVFPDALLKIYLVASIEERARRRARESEPEERACDPAVLASYAQSLAERDRRDRSRSEAPLVAADDAVRVDTSDLTPADQVARVVRLAHERMS